MSTLQVLERLRDQMLRVNGQALCVMLVERAISDLGGSLPERERLQQFDDRQQDHGNPQRGPADGTEDAADQRGDGKNY
jgi:hypothetical protein